MVAQGGNATRKKPASKGQLSGSLKERSLETLIYYIFSKKMTSELLLERENSKRSLYFKDGAFIFAGSMNTAESFSRYLIQNNFVDAPKAKELKEKAIPSLLDGCDLLAKTPSDIKGIKDHAKNFSTQLGISCFQWLTADFSVKPFPAALQKTPVHPMDPRVLIYKGIQRHYEMDLLATKFSKIQDRALVLTPEFREGISQFNLTKPQIQLLQKIDGKKTINELVVTEGLDLVGAFRLIWAFFSLRLLGMMQSEEKRRQQEELRKKEEGEAQKAKATTASPVVPKVKEEPLDPKKIRKEIEGLKPVYEKMNFFQILKVDRKANAAKIRSSYMSLAKRFHPDVLTNLGLKDHVILSGSIFAKMTEAHATLIDKDRRKEYEAQLDMDPKMIARMNDIVRAESEFLKGEAFLRNRSYERALEQFQLALRLNSEEAEHHVYVGWTKYLLEKDNKIAAIAEARQMIQKGLGMRSNIDMAYVFLGRLAKASNQMAEAEAQFYKALDLNPSNEQASTELRYLKKK